MITLPDLPYAHDALAPVMSEDTLRTHHGKHHRKYVDVTNQIVEEKGLTGLSLEELILKARADGATKLKNNAEQAWNHAFFWESMTPDAKPAPEAFAAVKDEFLAEALAHFGSGWAWLVSDGQTISVESTHDAANFVGSDKTPLIVCDVWEHAYYLDHKNDREAFLKAWWDQLANWDFAQAQLDAAKAHAGRWEFAKAA